MHMQHVPAFRNRPPTFVSVESTPEHQNVFLSLRRARVAKRLLDSSTDGIGCIACWHAGAGSGEAAVTDKKGEASGCGKMGRGSGKGKIGAWRKKREEGGGD